jgi:hypothetical protein
MRASGARVSVRSGLRLPRSGHSCFLALDVQAVRLFDQLAGRLLSLVVRVMAGAQQELAADRRVGADAPAATLMAVELAAELVHARHGRADEAELNDVRTEPGPEGIVGTATCRQFPCARPASG